jgi:hypothetical protein
MEAGTPRRRAAPLASSLATVSTLGLLVATCIAGCGDQPKTNCLTSTAPYAMKLIEKTRTESVTGACADFGPAAFNVDPEVGFTSYYPQDSKGQPDYAKGSLAIQTTEMGNLIATADGYMVKNTAADGTRFSLGAYSVTEPNASNLCHVPTLSATHVVLAEVAAVADDPNTPDVDESFPGQPAVDAKLEWSNVLVYLTAASFGTQVQADLVDTRKTPTGNTCTIKYRTVSMAPAVPCVALDDNGDPLKNPDGTPTLDPTLCDPEANPGLMRYTGSGISPNTKYICDPDSAFCVLDGETVPALK